MKDSFDNILPKGIYAQYPYSIWLNKSQLTFPSMFYGLANDVVLGYWPVSYI